MSNSKKTLFIADLHLDESQPAIKQKLLGLLDFYAPSLDAIYILGDLFELWIGDDHEPPFVQDIINTLKKMTEQGLPIYLLYGNRDFLIGQQFLTKTGCQLLPDEAKMAVYETPVLLMHGDTLCTQDIAYIKARKKARNPFLQKLFLMLPLKIRKMIAAKMRRKSKQHTQATPLKIMDVSQQEVERLMKKHNVNYLVHGHTHRPNVHHFNLNDSEATRIVLGAWHDEAHILIWEESGRKNLLTFSQWFNHEQFGYETPHD